MHNVKEKMSKVIRKYGITKQTKAKHLDLGLCKILTKCNDN
jgi:hypothetical protein